MELLERERERAVLTAAIAQARRESSIVLVVGEAGIGKTSLVAAATDGARRVFWGACDPLITPRPLGPLRDVARQAGWTAVEREAVLDAALDELAGGAILVIEDLHWADDATLDLVALLGRRLERLPGCLIVTSRSDAQPELRRVLGTLARLRRVEPAALSAAAVERLAHRAGHDAAELYALSAGNPFFVTELLAAPPGGGVPASVRDAVAARVAALSPAAREVAELAAVVPGAIELALVAPAGGAIDECIDAGLLCLRGDALAYRHDLARQAVEDGLAPVRRRELDARVLAALEAVEDVDPARLVHHARRAGDAAAVRRFAPVAARAAAAARGHRQALAHWEAALAAGGNELEALEGIALEAYLCGHMDRAVETRRTLLAFHEAEGDRFAAGVAQRWLARVLWWAGRGPEAREACDRAISLLEAFPESRELAVAVSARSQLAMLSEDRDQATALARRAVDLARALDDRETVAHALNNLGTALLGGSESARGRALLEESFVLATGIGQDDHAARALVNLAASGVTRLRDDPRVGEDIERALAFVRERELDGYLQYVLGLRAVLRLRRCDWAGAEADAQASLRFGEHFGVSQCPALTVLGRLGARRGEPEAAAELLDDAWDRAVATMELQRLAPAATARAEAAWLEGDDSRAREIARPAHELAAALGDRWARAELAFWLRRVGDDVPAAPDDPAPFALLAAGDARAAADAFAALGCPYDRAEALAEGDEAAQLEALASFDALGAARRALVLRRRLRAAGVRRIPRGPRAASRAAPAGLTPRETEVLDLIVRGATNAEIAQALVIAPKTVDHHVSAVLSKLGVSSRRDAGAALAHLTQT
ncbi:MAG TPA: AAA family ATPase [Solirubrobacter sp.]|nr:AAA family ATPase [Solirubrobacter sp.]